MNEETENGSHELVGKYAELARRVETTCKSRYNASSRLDVQHRFSQWTIGLLSVGLIIIPLIQLSGIETNFSSSYVNVMQIVFASLVLVYSLLIGSENLSRRAERLHRCGLELSRLSRELKPYKEGEFNDFEAYKAFHDRYYEILEKYENHSGLDFLLTQLDLRPRYFSSAIEFWLAWLWAHLLRSFTFSPHIVVLVVLISWIIFYIR